MNPLVEFGLAPYRRSIHQLLGWLKLAVGNHALDRPLRHAATQRNILDRNPNHPAVIKLLGHCFVKKIVIMSCILFFVLGLRVLLCHLPLDNFRRVGLRLPSRYQRIRRQVFSKQILLPLASNLVR